LAMQQQQQPGQGALPLTQFWISLSANISTHGLNRKPTILNC
jgi:hypothetical protein